MDILIIDKDTLSSQMIGSKLEGRGHGVVTETVKNNALDKASQKNFDVVLFDPAPLTNARSMILNLRRALGNYSYIILLKNPDADIDTTGCGANDVQEKPADPDGLADRIEHAETLLNIFKQYGDESIDFPSAGGVIAKSAFNQLFLSAMERADRYNEATYLLRLSVKNYKDLHDMGGSYMSDYAVAKLSQHLVRIRRQSDIIGQTARNEYTLLLQRPQYESEPMDAANRFAEAFSKLDDMAQSAETPVEVEIELIELPTGASLVNHQLKVSG